LSRVRRTRKRGYMGSQRWCAPMSDARTRFAGAETPVNKQTAPIYEFACKRMSLGEKRY
jgi:hypothetical protein